MKEKIIEILKKYHMYLVTLIIIVLIIIMGFIYASKSTQNIIEEPEIKEEKEEEEKTVKTIKVDIKGNVKKTGVYELDENSRVIDAINKAGGFKDGADTSTINLSQKLKDEMIIIIYNKKEIEEFRETQKVEKYEKIEKDYNCPNQINDVCIKQEEVNKTEETNKEENGEEDISDELVSINTATKEQLLKLEGIGESKADAIIKYREENGEFKQIEDIKNVSGIGDSLFEKIKDYITI